jgi:methyl-accepting chemotaxis protein
MQLLNQYGVILAILALIIGAGVYLYGTAKKGRRDYLRADNVDLNNSNNLLREKVEGLEESIKTLTATVLSLRDVATQTPAVTQLLEQTANQHAQVITQLADLTKEISKLTREFSHVAQAITANSKAQEKNSVAQDKNSKAQDHNTRSREA